MLDFEALIQFAEENLKENPQEIPQEISAEESHEYLERIAKDLRDDFPSRKLVTFVVYRDSGEIKAHLIPNNRIEYFRNCVDNQWKEVYYSTKYIKLTEFEVEVLNNFNGKFKCIMSVHDALNQIHEEYKKSYLTRS